MRYFVELSYRGTNYCGWQRQDNAPSVQQTLDEALSTLLREQVATVGAGRTDTGVHAAYYVAHFDTAMQISAANAAGGGFAPNHGSHVDGEFAPNSTGHTCPCHSDHAVRADGEFVRRLNAILPRDIAVTAITRVADDAHARFDALAREYRYYILDHKDPFRIETAWQRYGAALDMEAMNAAAALLTRGATDFTTFSKLHSNNKTYICHVTHAEWTLGKGGGDKELTREGGGRGSEWPCRRGGELIFTICADRFLRNMVRALVGTLVDVGRGKLNVSDFEAALDARDRSLASGSAPAQGLFLSDIRYPENIFKRK